VSATLFTEDTDQPDETILQRLIDAILQGRLSFGQDVPLILRRAIDEVIDTPGTGRTSLAECEKTEKTYLGTKVQILLMNYLGFPKGQVLDMRIGSVELDVKNTCSKNWSIPKEAVGHPCLIVRENEATSCCSVGLIIAKAEYLCPGRNRDLKRIFSAARLQNAMWLLRDHPYPGRCEEAA
jgi:hypothetical protein